MANPAVVAVIFGVAIATVLYFMFGSQAEHHSQKENNQPYRHNYYKSENRNLQQSIDDNGDKCTICFVPLMHESIVELYCHHTFHKKCIEAYIQHQHRNHVVQVCPLCRAPIKF